MLLSAGLGPFEQSGDGLGMASCCGSVQGGEFAVAPRVGVGANIKQRGDFLDVVLLDVSVQAREEAVAECFRCLLDFRARLV